MAFSGDTKDDSRAMGFIGAAKYRRPKKKVPKVDFSVLQCLIYVQERREMGQTALETTLNELKHVLLLPILFCRSGHL